MPNFYAQTAGQQVFSLAKGEAVLAVGVNIKIDVALSWNLR